MPKMRMTKRAIEAIEAPDPSGEQTLYWDEGADRPGLGILVSGKTSTKTWVVQGKPAGQTRRLTLGPVGVLSIEEAWAAARPKLAEMYSGVDPKKSAAKRARDAMTLSAALEGYIAAMNLRPRSVRVYRETAARHLTPFLDLPLRAITPAMVDRQFREIREGIAARRAAGDIHGGVNVEGRASANAAVALLRSVWRFQARRDDALPACPVKLSGREWHKIERRTRHIAEGDLARFYGATEALPSPIQRDAVRLILFTGMRAQEGLGLRWSEVDLTARMIRIPASRMKNKRDFALPMSDYVRDLLIARRALGNDGDFVFPGNSRSGHLENLAYTLRSIADATGVFISAHDVRRTFASIAEAAEIGEMPLKRLLSHTTAGVTEGYVQLSDARLRAAAQRVCDRLMELCGIAAPEPVENVSRLG